MPGNSPPFPVARSPHLDLAIRELYARLGRLERIFNVTSPGGTPGVPSVGVSEAILVQMANMSLTKNQGWYHGIDRNLYASDSAFFGEAPRVVTYLDAPGVVLGISAYLAESFNPEGQVALVRSPDVVIVDYDLGEAEGEWWLDFWGKVEADDVDGGGWVGSSVIVIERLTMPPRGPEEWWRNIGVLHRRREVWGRPGVTNLPYLPIVIGFRWGEPGAAVATQSEGEPAGSSIGKLHFVVVYSEALFGREKPETVPIKELGTATLESGLRPTLLSELGVKAA